MAIEIAPNLLLPLLPERKADAHKGTFGHLLVLAGSRGFTGAAKMTSEAAMRSGVGLVTLGVPEPLGDIMATALTEVMSVLLPATDAESLSYAALKPALECASSKQAVVLGPGLSRHSDTRDFVLSFTQRCTVPLLVDADGLNGLSAEPDVLAHCAAPRVLTPHPGEMARLRGIPTPEVQGARESVAADFAKQYGHVVVLKGYRTVVAGDTGEVYVNPTGNSGLASGGTGDVLSGLIGGLMAQGMRGLDAALVGVYLHGLAGDLAAADLTERAMIAGDVIQALPRAWRALEHER